MIFIKWIDWICDYFICKLIYSPWVNNCVGENNQKYFVLFTVSDMSYALENIIAYQIGLLIIWASHFLAVLYCNDFLTFTFFGDQSFHHMCETRLESLFCL